MQLKVTAMLRRQWLKTLQQMLHLLFVWHACVVGLHLYKRHAIIGMGDQSIFLQIKQSCARLVEKNELAGVVQVRREKIAGFIQNLALADSGALLDTCARPLSLPLSFSDDIARLNFISLWCLLSFGHGFRKELHEACNRGTADTILYGMIAMFISGKPLDAHFLMTINASEIAGFFGLPVVQEKLIQGSSALSTVKRHVLFAFAEQIANVLNSTGKILRLRQCTSLGLLVHEILKESNSAAHLVQAIASIIPAFNDRNEDALFMKKAQLLTNELYSRRNEFSLDLSKLMQFDDIDQTTLLPDNVLPTVLTNIGILEVSEALDAKTRNGVDIDDTLGSALRAATIVAGEDITSQMKQSAELKHVSCAQLDKFFWKLGKRADFRCLPRHSNKNTIFY